MIGSDTVRSFGIGIINIIPGRKLASVRLCFQSIFTEPVSSRSLPSFWIRENTNVGLGDVGSRKVKGEVGSGSVANAGSDGAAMAFLNACVGVSDVKSCPQGLSYTFVVCKKEPFIFYDRSADIAAELIQSEVRTRKSGCVIKEIVCIEMFVSEVVERHFRETGSFRIS